MGRTIADDLMARGHSEGRTEGRSEGRTEGLAEGLARGQLDTAHATLIRLLGVRFGELPDKIVTVVQATDNLKQLNTWLDRVVTADTLEDFEFEL